MTQGIFSSLNSTLARLNSIEQNFSALQGISDELNAKTLSPVETQQASDFQTILDKIKKEKEGLKEKKFEIELDKKIETSPLDEKLDKFTKEAVNLKSKIDLKAQRADIDEIIDTYSDKYGIDSDFIKAIIRQESGFKKNAQSKKGAMGLMQLMPETAKSLGVINAYDPVQNIEGGTKYLKGLMDRFDGDKRLALAAYNAGPNAVKRYGGIPPYKETQNYVKNIMSVYEKLQQAKGGSL